MRKHTESSPVRLLALSLAVVGGISVQASAQSSPKIDLVAVPAIELAMDSDLRATSVQPLLDARQVACEVATKWTPAKQLQQHAQTLRQLYCKAEPCPRQTAEAAARFLELQAEHQLDIASAVALRAYYARVAVDEQLTLVAESMRVLDDRVERQAQWIKKGMAAVVDPTAFDRERLELESKRLQLKQKSDQLERSLNELAYTQYDWKGRTVEPLEVRSRTIDVSLLQSMALQLRHDLKAIEVLQPHINDQSAPMLASSISALAGLAALPLPKLAFIDRLLGRKSYPGLTNNLKQELALAKETQTRTIRQAVADKASVLELAYQRIELSKQTIESWQLRQSQLVRLAELGDSRAADLAAAESGLLQSRSNNIERRLEAKLAEVDLAEAVGCLHHRCCAGQAWLITGR